MIDRRIGKIKVRRGKEIERKPIIFEEGELIYSIDKQRLYIGDGVLPGGILVSNRNYVVSSLGATTKMPPSTAVYGDIIHETSTNRTYIIGYESDNITLKLILLADGNCCIRLQNEIDDLYARLRPLTACLNPEESTKSKIPVAPTFSWSVQPTSISGNVGETATLHARAYGPSSIVYQWSNMSTGDILGAIGEYYVIPSLSLSDIGNYICKATASIGTITSNPASISVEGNSILTESGDYILTESGDYIDWTIGSNTAPTITLQPRTQSTLALINKTFEVRATGSLPLYYQWRVNGVDLFGETKNTYIVQNPTIDILGITCKVSNIAGVAVSDSVNLIVGSSPVITKQPIGTTASKGSRIVLDVDASGSPPLTYQWICNESLIAGANSDTYTINSASNSDAGSYKCTVSNPYSSVTSDTVSIIVNNSFDAGDIIIDKNTNNFLLKDILIKKGWDILLPVLVNVYVNSGVTIGSNSTLLPAFIIDDLPTGSVVKLINNGTIQGAGGDGGYGDPNNLTWSNLKEKSKFIGFGSIINAPQAAGKNGGDALKIAYTNPLNKVSIVNNGSIWSGGGGGAGGQGFTVETTVFEGPLGGGGAGTIAGKEGGMSNSGGPVINKTYPTVLNETISINSGEGGGPGQKGKDASNKQNVYFAETISTGGLAGIAVDGDSFITWITKGDVKGEVK